MFNSIDEETTVVFVYGTLKRNFRNSHYLKNAKFIGDSETIEKFSMITCSNYNFPILFKNNELNLETQKIEGELYRVTPEILENLDFLERGLYEKTLIEVLNKSNNNKYNAYAYTWIYDTKNLKNIKSINTY